MSPPLTKLAAAVDAGRASGREPRLAAIAVVELTATGAAACLRLPTDTGANSEIDESL